MTSKLQLTVPKAVADQYGIRPGDELEFVPTGDSIRVVLANKQRNGRKKLTVKERLELFDKASERQRVRNEKYYKEHGFPEKDVQRDWKREDIYTRGFPR